MRSYGGWKGSGEAWAPGITLTRANSYGVLLLYQELAQRFLSVTSEYLVLSIYWILRSSPKGSSFLDSGFLVTLCHDTYFAIILP